MTGQRKKELNIGVIKKLHNILNNDKLFMPDEAEAGNAGEQPGRNNPADWNNMEVGINIRPPIINYSCHLYLKKLKYFSSICQFHAGAVQL